MKHLKMSSHPGLSASSRPLALFTLAGLLCVPALAQPNPPGGGQGAFQRGAGQGGGFGGGPGFGRGQGGPGRGDRAQMREAMLKMQLEDAGYTNVTLQNAILTFAKSKDAGRQPLQAAANALSLAMVDETATNAQIGQLLDTFTRAISSEKTRLQNEEKQLDNQIKFSSDKRLMAILTLSGVIGDATSYLGGPNGGRGAAGGPGNGPDMGGRGGRGGGRPQGEMGGPGMGGPGMGGRGMGGPPPRDF